MTDLKDGELSPPPFITLHHHHKDPLERSIVVIQMPKTAITITVVAAAPQDVEKVLGR